MSAEDQNSTPPVTPTPVSGWKKPVEATVLPSGNAMVLRRPGFQAFMKSGLIPNSLLGMAQSAISSGKGLEEPDVQELIKDTDKVTDMMSMVDEVTVFCAVQPEVSRAPAIGVDRDPNILYVDEIDDEDKMFIFSYATGGSADVESFRDEARNVLGALATGQDVEGSPQPASGD